MYLTFNARSSGPLMWGLLIWQAGQEEGGEDGLLAEMAEVKKRMEQRNKRDKKKTKEQKKRSRIRAAQLALGRSSGV